MKDVGFRDPVHGFISVRALEREIIDSLPFQRLRYIKQLSFSYYVFHGAEHTRFGHSIGVMHLVSRAFLSAAASRIDLFSQQEVDWYEQILRIIALTHDLGHAPFSHASESVFPEGLEHEDYTEKIIKETCIANIILKIGENYKQKYGPDFDITPDLICDIYAGRNPGRNSHFTFLKSFMDSELDCDKMDYLLRDSLYCGVNYGKFDVERLLSSLTIYLENNEIPRLAVTVGGVQAFEEFFLARYFMFIQVYFHRTRRYFDIMFFKALKRTLPNGTYPSDTQEYLKWDDIHIIELFRQNDQIPECKNILNRFVYPRVYKTKTHPQQADQREYKSIKRMVFTQFGENNFIEDCSAGKLPHKIPILAEPGSETAITIIDEASGKTTTISEESEIIKCLTQKINIQRLYVSKDLASEVRNTIQDYFNEI